MNGRKSQRPLVIGGGGGGVVTAHNVMGPRHAAPWVVMSRRGLQFWCGGAVVRWCGGGCQISIHEIGEGNMIADVWSEAGPGRARRKVLVTLRFKSLTAGASLSLFVSAKYMSPYEGETAL